MSFEVATDISDIYIAVERLHREVVHAQELTMPGSMEDYHFEGKKRGLAQVMQILQDDFGVLPASWSLRP